MKKIGISCQTAVRQLLITFIGIFCFFNLAVGQVTSNQPDLAIETCDDVFETSYFTLPDIVFSETSNNDFIAGTTIFTINLPANFEFNTAVNPTLTETGSNVTSLTVGTPAYNGLQTLQINITIFGTSTVDQITISGLQIRGLNSVTSSSDITYGFDPDILFNGLANGATVATVSSGSLSVTSGGTTNSAQTLCLGTIPAQLTVTGSSTTSDPGPVPGETYQWESSTDGSSWSSVVGEVGINFTPPAITESIYYRRQTILTRNGFSCSDFSTSVFLELNQITAGAIIGNQTICEGTNASNLTQSMAASGSGTFTYQWEENESGTWDEIVGATDANYSPGAITTSTQYRRKDISDLTGVLCSAYTNTVTVTVLPPVVGGTAEVSAGVADQTVCSGTIPATISITGSSGGTTYEWYKSTDDVSYTIIAGEVSTTLTFSATPSETTFYRRKSIANGTGDSCDEFSSPSIVYVNNISAGSIDGTQTICDGTTASVLTQTAAASGASTLSYQWESDESGSWADIAGATSATYSPGAISTTIQYRRKDISTLNSLACSEYTNTITVTVLPTVVGGTAEVSVGVADQSVCSGDTPATISITGGSSGISYQWQSSTDNVTFSDIPGEVAEDLTFAATPSATTYYRREATAAGTGSTCFDISSVSTVFVNQITAGVISSDQTICNGSTANGLTEDTGAAHSGTITYQWESDGSGSWANIGGETQATYNPGAVASTTQYRRKDISSLNSVECTEYTNTVTITVLATVVGGTAEVSAGVSDQTICADDIPATISVDGSSGGTSFQWQSSTDNITFSDIAGETGANLAFSASPAVTTYYQRVASSSGSGSTCSDISSVSSVFLNQISAGTIAGEQTICNGETASILSETAPASFSGTITYQWESDESGGWADIAGATLATYAPGVLTETIQYRRRDISTLNGKACSENSNIITVNVLSATTGGTAEVSTGVPDQTICASDIPATISVDGGAGGTGYQWQSSTDNINFSNIAGEVASNLIFTVAPAQTTYYRRLTLNSSGGVDCPELSTVSTVIINDIASGVIGNNQTICYNTLASNIIELTPAVPSGLLTQQWESKVGAGAWTAIAGETDVTYSPGTLTQTTQYRRVDISTLNSEVCFAYTNVITIEVLPEVAGGTSSADETLCADDIPATITVAGALGVSGQWQSSTDNITFNDIAGEAGLTLAFTAPITETTYYRREVSTTINIYTCTDYSSTTVKTLNVMKAGTIGSNQIVCYGTILPNFSELVPSNFAGVLTHQWESKTESGAWTTIAGETDATYAPGIMTETMQYRRIDYSTLNTVVCNDISNEITITVSSEFDPGTASPATQTVCQGGDPAILTVTGGETVDVTFQWYESTDGGTTFNQLVGETGPEYNPPLGIMTSTYYYRETISVTPGTTCSDITAPVFVEVNTFDAGEISSIQTVCGGDTPATITSITNASAAGTITYSWESSTDLITWTPIVNDQETYDPGVLTETTYFRRVASSNLSGLDCDVRSNISSVYVNQFSNDDAHQVRMWYGSTGPVTVCFNSSPGTIVENFELEANIGATISFLWQTSNDNVTWNNVGGATGSSFSPPGVTADIFYRRVSTTTLNGLACPIYSNAIKFEVGANVNAGSVATSNPNSTSGSSLIEIAPYGNIPSVINNVTSGSGDGSVFEYLWFMSSNGINFSAAPGVNDGESYTPVNPVLQTTWFRRVHYRTYFSIECGVYSSSTQVQVIVPSPGLLNDDQAICVDGDPEIIETDTDISTMDGLSYLEYQWESSTDNVDYTPIAGETNISFNPAAGQFTATTYLRRITNTIIDGTDFGVISYSETDIVILNVNTISAGLISGDQSICHSSIPNDITSATLPEAHGVASYEWWSSTDGTTYSIINDETDPSYSFTEPLIQSTYYKRKDISTFDDIECSEFTNSVLVEITEVNGGTLDADQTVCTTDNPATINVTGAIGAFAQWQDSIAGGTWTNIIGEQSTNLTFTAPITETTHYRRKTWSSSGGGDCEDYSTISTVFINLITVGAIGSDQLLCYNSLVANLTVVSMPSGSGTITYQWEKNDSGAWGEIGGADQPTYSPGNLTATTSFKRKDTSTLNGVACSEYTNEVTVEIVSEVQGGSTNGDQTVCSTDNPATIVVTGSLGTNAQWQKSTDGASWASVAGETGTSLAFATPLTETTYFRLRLWETIGVLTCEDFSPIVTIYVNEIVAGVIGSNQLLCYNSPVASLTVATPASGSGTMSYQWEKNDSGTWEEILNATQPTYSPGALTTTTLFRRNVTSTLYGDDCPLYTNEVTIEILPEVLGGTTNGDQVVCSNGTPATIEITGSKGTNKQWESSTDGTTWNVVAGETGTTLAFAAPITETTMYRLHVWEVSGGLTCEKYSLVVTLTLNEITPGEIGSDQILCYNSTVANFTVVTPVSGTGNITYQWEKDDSGTWEVIAGATQPTYSPGALTVTTLFRRKDISTVDGSPCSDYTNIVTVEIYNELTGGTTDADQFVCLGQIPASISTDGIKGALAIWQQSTDMATWNDIAGQNGETLFFSASLTETTHFRWKTWTTTTDLTCEDYSTVTTVNVNVIEPGEITADQLLCGGDLAETFTEAKAPVYSGILSHQWQSSTDLFNWPDIVGATGSTYGSSPSETTYFRRKDISTLPGGHECFAYTDTVKITIDEYPVIDDATIADNDVTPVSCNGGSDGAIIIPLSRITGGNIAQKQIINVILSGTAAVDDIYTIIINGTTYSHTVILNGSSNPQTNIEIAADLTATISSGAASATVVDETITLTAQIAGSPFTAFASTGASANGKMTTQVVQENKLPNIYEWTKLDSPTVVSTNLSISDLTGGFYQLVVSNNVCTDTAVIEVPEPEELIVEIDTTCNNSITARISGGNENYEVTLVKPDNSTEVKNTSGDVTFTNLELGASYTLNIVDAPCTQTYTKVVTVPLGLQIDEGLITVTDIQCGGTDDGSITLDPNAISGGVEPYQYSWSIFDGLIKVQISTDRDLIELAADTYYLDIVDNLGCTASYSTTINSKEALNVSSVATNQTLSCPDDASASILISVTSDPSSLIEINWFKDGVALPALQNQLEIIDLDAGKYHVEVVDVNVLSAVCMVADTVEITAPDPFIISEELISETPDCFSETYRGSITYEISGGTEPYSYQLDGGEILSFTPDENGFIQIADLDTGDHVIVFSEFYQCKPDTSINFRIETIEPFEITYDEATDIIDVGCNLKGSIQVSVTGGTAPYFYTWQGPNNFSQSGTDLSQITDLEDIGVYSLIVTDIKQCKSEEINIELVELTTDFEVVELIRNGECASNNDASIELTVSSDIVVPYTVEWEKWDLTDPGNPDCISDCYSWQPTPSASGQLTMSNLGPGEYRVTIIDGSNSLCDTYVKTFSLANSSIEMIDNAVRLPDCEDSNFGYTFRMKAENLLKFYLNGTEISLAAGSLYYNSFTDQYIIKNLVAGDYLLRVVEQLPSGDEGCEILQNFTVGDFTVLAYTGATSHELDVCELSYNFTLDTSLVEGGVPFEDLDGNTFYNYEWTAPDNSVVTGFINVPVSIGIYQLVVKDQRGCATDPILFNFTVNYNEIEVFEDIQNVSCGGVIDDGAIQVTIQGGREPYSITWEKEIVSPTNGETTFSSIASNTLNISDLSPGRYRLTVLSNFDNCESSNPIVRFETFYTIGKDETVTIIDGPYLSKELCGGTPGFLTIQVTEISNGSTIFYYDENLVNAEFIGDGTYEVYVDSPVSDAILNAINEAGCGTFVIIEDGVANPSFRYESEGFLQFGITAVGEEIEFINTTTDVYDSLTWDFGDGSDIVPLSIDQEKLVDVIHTYETEGQFDVTLAVFNEAGCSNEIQNMVTIGKGYNVMFPTAFTPNGDGINDYFEGGFSGIVAFTLNIYDTWNNLIFTTSHETTNLPVHWGWDGKLSDGKPFNSQVFKYIFYGTRLNQEVVIVTDNAIIIK